MCSPHLIQVIIQAYAWHLLDLRGCGTLRIIISFVVHTVFSVSQSNKKVLVISSHHALWINQISNHNNVAGGHIDPVALPGVYGEQALANCVLSTVELCGAEFILVTVLVDW